MTWCRRCTRDVPHPCPSAEHAQNCANNTLETFAVGDVAYVLREDPEIGFPRGTEVTIAGLATPRHEDLPAVYINSPIRMGTFYYFARDLSHNAPPVTLPLCQFCNNRVEMPCLHARVADACDRTGILRAGRGSVEIAFESGETIRSTVGDLIGTAGTGIGNVARELSGEPPLEINWDAVSREPPANAHSCAQCGELVSHPCANPHTAQGCELPSRVLRESGWLEGGVSGRDFPPAVRALCASIQAQRGGGTTVSERRALAPPSSGYCVRGSDGNLNAMHCARSYNAAIVSYLVIACAFPADHDVVNDWATVLDVWENGPERDGCRVEPVVLMHPSRIPQGPARWQRMTTAPRDGVCILMAHQDAMHVPHVAVWDRRGWWGICGVRGDTDGNHMAGVDEGQWRWTHLPRYLSDDEPPFAYPMPREREPSPWNVEMGPEAPPPVPREPAPRRRAIRT